MCKPFFQSSIASAMSQSSNGSNCSYEQRRIADSADLKKRHDDLKRTHDDLKKKPPRQRPAKEKASKTIGEITARVTRSSQNQNLPLTSKLPTYQPKRI